MSDLHQIIDGLEDGVEEKSLIKENNEKNSIEEGAKNSMRRTASKHADEEGAKKKK